MRCGERVDPPSFRAQDPWCQDLTKIKMFFLINTRVLSAPLLNHPDEANFSTHTQNEWMDRIFLETHDWRQWSGKWWKGTKRWKERACIKLRERDDIELLCFGRESRKQWGKC